MAHKKNRTTKLKKSLPKTLKRDIPQIGRQERQTIDLQVREIKADERRVTVSFSSEQSYSRWFGVEILQHDADSVDLSRLSDIGVALFNHNRDKVLGKIENVRLDEKEKRTYADIVFDDDEDTNKIFKKVESGTLKGVSVGYSVEVWEDVAAGEKSTNGRFQGPAYIATRWTPMEVSIVSIPADDSVGVGREIENTNIYGNLVNLERGKKMLKRLCEQFGLDYDSLVARGMNDEQIQKIIDDLKRGQAQSPPQPPTQENNVVDVEAVKREAETTERNRGVEVSALCKEFDVDPKEYLEKGNTVQSVRDVLFEKMKTERTPLPGSNQIEVTGAEEDKVRDATSDAILMRAGIRLEKPAEGAMDFRGASLRDLAVECLVRIGVANAHRLGDDELFKRALSPDSQFSALTTNAVSKAMAVDNDRWQPTYKRWTGIGSNKDFKAAKHYQLSSAGNLVVVPQSGEVKQAEMSDNEVSKSIATYAKKWGLTRQALINDDIDMLVRIPMAYNRAALNTVNVLVYTILGENSTIYNGNSLFDASNHGNYITAGGAPSTATIKIGRAAMRKQKDIGSKRALNIAPRFLIVPAALETEAEQLVGSLADPSANNANVVNPWKNLQVVSDAVLDDLTSTGTGWFLASDPRECDNIEVTSLNGNDTPALETKAAFDTLGMEWRIYMDAGVTVTDFRGLFYNDGVA